MSLANPNYSAKKTAQKGASDGAIATGVVTVVTAVVGAIQSNNPDLSLGGEADAVVVGAISGGILGLIRAFRNWLKNR